MSRKISLGFKYFIGALQAINAGRLDSSRSVCKNSALFSERPKSFDLQLSAKYPLENFVFLFPE